MLRTRVPIRTVYGVTYADAIASVRCAGYTFLVHKSYNGYTTTYAPSGHGIGVHPTPGDAVSFLLAREHRIDDHISRALCGMAEEHWPLLAPECGIQSFDWRWREQCRFESGEYKAVPGIDSFPAWAKDHFLHLSTTKTETDFVAYTPSEDYGVRDRQVRLKFGKYLKKEFPGMTDAEIQSAVVKLRAAIAYAETPVQLHFATDRETINSIFETPMYACDSSCTSCMYGKFEGDDRPYHVYADSPDVAVAYIVDHGNIVARSVVSTKNRVWVRSYSVKRNDSTLCEVLENMLSAAGYSEGSLKGSRLSKVGDRRSGSPLLPYIDHSGMGVKSSGKYWVVCESGHGDYDADNTNGEGSRVTPRCPNCEEPEDDCSCIYCECCEERYVDGCGICTTCEQCDRCRTHELCTCEYCASCDRLVIPRYGYIRGCECDRCAECGYLIEDCACDKCENCARLITNCECAPNESETETDTEAVVEVML